MATVCSPSLYDLETSGMRRPWPTSGRSSTEKKKTEIITLMWATLHSQRATLTKNCTESVFLKEKFGCAEIGFVMRKKRWLYQKHILWETVTHIQWNVKPHYS